MRRFHRFVRPVYIALVLASLGACGGNEYGYYADPHPYDYPWYYTRYGTYTFIRRPIHVVDGWTSRAFHHRPYRGYRVRRHNSPEIVYNGAKEDRVIDVNLRPMGDSTRVEVKFRRGEDGWDQEQARIFLSNVLRYEKK